MQSIFGAHVQVDQQWAYLGKCLQLGQLPKVLSMLWSVTMVKCMEEARVSSLLCVAHTLQLIVTEGLLSQHSVSQAVGIGH